MLVLTRLQGEKLLIGDDIVIEFLKISPRKCKVGIHAPEDMEILRAEIREDDDGSDL